MKRFYLRKSGKKIQLSVLIFIVIYFLLQYFFRNQLLPVIFILGMLFFVLVILIKSRKQRYIEIKNDMVTFRDEIEDKEFTFSKSDLKISLFKYESSNGRLSGPAIGFHNSGIENITIGILAPLLNWKQPEGVISEVMYKFEINEWDNLIKALDLSEKIEKKTFKLTEGQQNIAKTVLYAVLIGLIGLAIWIFYYFIFVEKVFEL